MLYILYYCSSILTDYKLIGAYMTEERVRREWELFKTKGKFIGKIVYIKENEEAGFFSVKGSEILR